MSKLSPEPVMLRSSRPGETVPFSPKTVMPRSAAIFA
jgi:hypothetical protein